MKVCPLQRIGIGRGGATTSPACRRLPGCRRGGWWRPSTNGHVESVFVASEVSRAGGFWPCAPEQRAAGVPETEVRPAACDARRRLSRLPGTSQPSDSQELPRTRLFAFVVRPQLGGRRPRRSSAVTSSTTARIARQHFADEFRSLTSYTILGTSPGWGAHIVGPATAMRGCTFHSATTRGGEMASDQEIAQEIAQSVRLAESQSKRRSWRKVTTLLAAFGLYNLTDAARSRIGTALDEAGLVVEPPMAVVQRAGSVRLSSRNPITHDEPETAGALPHGVTLWSWRAGVIVSAAEADLAAATPVLLDVVVGHAEGERLRDALLKLLPDLPPEALASIFRDLAV